MIASDQQPTTNYQIRTTTMRSAVLVAPGRFEIQEVPVPEPGPGEARIRIEGCGVCASNIPPFEGRDWFSYPMEPGALGHEGWGVIDATGPQTTDHKPQSTVKVGERVAFIGQHSYAEYDVAPIEGLVQIPDSLSGQPFPGEPLGCAMNIFKRAQVKAGDTVAIVGIGFLGSLLTQLCRNAGATVIAIARKEYALDIATQMGAAETVLVTQDESVVDRVGRLYDVAIECTGKQGPLDLAAELTKERGRLVIAGFHQDGLRTFNGFLWNWRGLDVINAHERDPDVYVAGIREAIAAVESGRLDPTPLYTHRFPLDEMGRALEMTKERPDGFMKALIEVGR